MSVTYDLNLQNGKHWIIHFVQTAIRLDLQTSNV